MSLRYGPMSESKKKKKKKKGGGGGGGGGGRRNGTKILYSNLGLYEECLF